ncbi:MAG: phage tail protein [Rhizobiaceae bacterium]|nr:phage tail protein [Rhizobiaceae bacterium]
MAAQRGVVLPLITLSGNVHGLHVIEAISEDQTFHDAFGRPRMDTYRISLKRYAGGGFSPIAIVASLFG